MGAPSIRAGRPDEAEVLLGLWREGGAVTTGTDDLPGVQGLLSSPHADVFIAEDRGRPVGSIVAAWDGWRGHMYRLVVVPEARRRGIAGALVAAAEEALRARGARRIASIVMAGDARARAFWTAAGYEHQPDVVRHARTVGA